MMAFKNRPEWVTCVTRPLVEGASPTSYCGQNVSGIFAFESVEHAAANKINGGRLMTCKACVKEIKKACGSEVTNGV